MERLYCDYCGNRIEKDNGESRIIYAGSSCGPQFVIASEINKSIFAVEEEMLSWGACERLHSCGSDCTIFLLTFFNLFGVDKFLEVLEKQREVIEVINSTEALYSESRSLCNQFVEADKEEEPDDENDEDKEDWEKQIERDGGRIPIRSIPNWKEAIIG